jgi:glycosyltransferase involved in cell wall biosynthesis
MPELLFFATIPSMNKTKILFVDHTPFAGGAQLRLAEDIKWLDRNKFEPFLLIDKSSKFESIYKKSNFRIYKITFSRLNILHPVAIPRLIRSIQTFYKVIQELEPDIVMTNTTRALLVVALASKVYRADFKLISYIRDYDYPKWMFPLIGDEVDKYLFVSKSVRSFYKLAGNVIYLGSEFKTKLNSLPKKFVIGFLGRLVDWKGAEQLLKAVHNLKQADVNLYIWGTGKGQKGSIEEKIKKQSGSGVKFFGHTSDPASAFSQMSCFVLPSQKPEPFATTLIEAALSKVPIIATDTGGTNEFVKNGKSGLLVMAGDTNQLSRALVRLKDDPNLASKLVEQAFLDAQKFTQAEFIKRFEKVLV